MSLDYADVRDAVSEALRDRAPSLRDIFAAHAMQGLIGQQIALNDILTKQGRQHVDLAHFIAAMALTYADAMIEERER